MSSPLPKRGISQRNLASAQDNCAEVIEDSRRHDRTRRLYRNISQQRKESSGNQSNAPSVKSSSSRTIRRQRYSPGDSLPRGSNVSCLSVSSNSTTSSGPVRSKDLVNRMQRRGRTTKGKLKKDNANKLKSVKEDDDALDHSCRVNSSSSSQHLEPQQQTTPPMAPQTAPYPMFHHGGSGYYYPNMQPAYGAMPPPGGVWYPPQPPMYPQQQPVYVISPQAMPQPGMAQPDQLAYSQSQNMHLNAPAEQHNVELNGNYNDAENHEEDQPKVSKPRRRSSRMNQSQPPLQSTRRNSSRENNMEKNPLLSSGSFRRQLDGRRGTDEQEKSAAERREHAAKLRAESESILEERAPSTISASTLSSRATDEFSVGILGIGDVGVLEKTISLLKRNSFSEKFNPERAKKMHSGSFVTSTRDDLQKPQQKKHSQVLNKAFVTRQARDSMELDFDDVYSSSTNYSSVDGENRTRSFRRRETSNRFAFENPTFSH